MLRTKNNTVRCKFRQFFYGFSKILENYKIHSFLWVFENSEKKNTAPSRNREFFYGFSKILKKITLRVAKSNSFLCVFENPEKKTLRVAKSRVFNGFSKINPGGKALRRSWFRSSRHQPALFSHAPEFEAQVWSRPLRPRCGCFSGMADRARSL